MEKQTATILKGILITGLSFLLIFPVRAQKEKGQSIITQDQVNKINEIVKPLKDQLNKQLSQDKTYAAYLDDVRKIKDAKSMEAKRSLTAKLDGKYLIFFQKTWSAANVDEKAYQEKIRAAFPEPLKSLIQFGSFLNFTVADSSFVLERVTPPPERPDTCLDVCTIAIGDQTGSGYLIAGGGGSFGNCFVRSNAWAAADGLNEMNDYLKNNIAIPGTLPDDDRKLRIKKSYTLRQEATAFASPGAGFVMTELETYRSNERLIALSPILWRSNVARYKPVNVEYTLQKRDVAKSVFHTYVEVVAGGISGSWGFTECTSIKWSICEEKVSH